MKTTSQPDPPPPPDDPCGKPVTALAYDQMGPNAQNRRVSPWWALVLVFAALLVAGGGYFLGRSGGEDLERARSDGRAAGERAGSAAGAERGYRSGLRKGRRQGYRSAYRTALRTKLRKGPGQVNVAPTRRSCGDIATEGAGSYNVHSVNVICDIALQVARQWEAECAQAGGDCTVRAGFTCDYQQTAYELGSITCSDNSRRVTFQTGS